MIKLNHVTKTRQSTIVLSSVDITFQDKENYAILCESKSDKTTLFNIIKGYETADDGTVETDEQKNIEYILEDSLLFSSLTVKENMQIKWLAKNKDLDKFEEQYIKALQLFDLENMSDTKIETLSDIKKKCLELAGAYIMNPKSMLLLDTLFDLPDFDKQKLISLIEDNFADTTVIIASCNADKKYFDNFSLLTLDKGEVTLHE